VGYNGFGLGGDGDYGAPPASAYADVADGEIAGDCYDGDEDGCADPAEADFHGFAALDALFSNVGGEGGPAVVWSVDGEADLVGGFEEAVSPVAGVEPEGTDVAPDDAFAEDAAGKLLVAILLQRDQVPLADLGHGSDLLERDSARNSLRSKLLPKSTHLVTSFAIIARSYSTGKLRRTFHV